MIKLSSRSAIAVFTAFFFCSGAAGLIYEVLWMRQFGLVMGNTTISLSAVLTAFMGGLAIGSWIGGRIADRRADHLRLYGLLEILIGLYALGVPLFITAIRPILAPLYQADPNGFALISIRFALALLIMVVPTIFMGATLPILIKHFTARENEVGQRVGLIYGINTFGAMFGAFLAGFLLIPRLGMNLTNLVAVVINLAVGVLAILIGWSHRSVPSDLEPSSAIPQEDETLTGTFTPAPPTELFAALAGIGLSGMAAMIYQVCWTRLFALLIGSSVYSFSMVVMANICGLAVGGVMFGRWIDRSKKPLMFFAGVQMLVALTCYAIIYFSEHYPIYVIRMLQQYQTNYQMILFQEFIFISFLIFVPTFMMGGMFPIAARICSRSVNELGKTIGSVYAVNTIGAVIGSFTAGLVFMRWFGLYNAVLVAVALNLVAAAISVAAQSGMRPVYRLGGLLPVALIAAVAFVPPSQWKQQLMSVGPFYLDRFDDEEMTPEGLRSRAYEGDLVYYQDGLAGTVAVKKYTRGIHNTVLSINGKIEASSNTGDMPTQLLCGHLGLLAHPPAESAMLIGLGGGFTLGALTQNENLKRIDLVEISESVIEAVRKYFHELTNRALDDPRLDVIIGDGRNHLTLTNKKYDIIANEPSNPWIAGISNLFTKEFFELALSRLTEDGVVVQWIHSYNMSYDDFMQVVKTFMSVMPHAVLWEANDGDYLMVGSRNPIQFDWNQMSEILNRPPIKKQMSVVNLDDPFVLMSGFMATKEQLQEHEDFQKTSLNEDDTCRLEFSAPKGFYDYTLAATQYQLDGLRFSPVPVITPDSLTPEIKERLENIRIAKEMVTKVIEEFDMDAPGESVAALQKAIALSPRDPILRRRASELYFMYLEDTFDSRLWDEARTWALRIVDLFDDLGVAVNHWDQAKTYRLLYLCSKNLNDEKSMQLSYAGLKRIGGDQYADKMTVEFPE